MQEEFPFKRGYVLAALMMTMALAAMDATIVSTVIPVIVDDLGGFEKFSWIFSVYLLAQTVTIPIYGKLADIFGRKKILIFGITLFLIGSSLCAFSWDIISLIIFRGIQGLGAGSIMASVNTIAGDIYTVEERAAIQGWLSSIWGISAIIGPALGGTIAQYISWRWIFLFNIPIGILSIAFLILFFKEKIIPKNVKIDYKGSVLILLTVSLLIIFLLESGQSWEWISKESTIILACIFILGYFTFKIENKTEGAVLPSWVWKNKTLMFTNFAMIFMGIVMMGPDTFLPTFAQASLGHSMIISGFILASMSVGWPTASALSGRLYLKIGFRKTAFIGACIITLGFILFLLIPWPQSVVLLIISQIFLGAGFGLLSTPSLVGAQSMVKWEKRGVTTSLIIFCRNLGQSVGASIVGAIFNNSLSMQMKKAPLAYQAKASDVLHILKGTDISDDKRYFLAKAFNISTGHIYIALVGFALLIIFFIYKIPGDSTTQREMIE
ncbi:MAG: MFS transporter [Chitinophagales bacterium]|nr:MFS transporter [Chitinophagales bacterium]